jgi:two-component system sensor histidine kinase KdpD
MLSLVPDPPQLDSFTWASLRAALRREWKGYAVALLAVGLVSLVIWIVERRLHIGNISMLYLIAVLGTATFYGRAPAILASAAAFLSFDWFFVEPHFTLTVADPEEWVALLLFLLTAVITGQLAAGQRLRAREALEREREAIVLYDVGRLLGEPELDRALSAVAERLRQELQLTAAVVEVEGAANRSPIRVVSGSLDAFELIERRPTTPTRVLGQGAPPSESRRGSTGRWVRTVPPRSPGGLRTSGDLLHLVPIAAGGRRLGTLYLVRGQEARFSARDDRLLATVAAQIALAVERERLRREATESEVLRRTDELKTALLNAVSHDLRTPLASIIASAGSLRQPDIVWSEEEIGEFAEAIEQEAQRLNRIVGHLLDMSRIEAGNLRPAKDWYALSALVDDVLGRLRPATEDHVFVVDVPEDLPPVPLDYVEIDQVLTNLLENAAKYTPAGTEIRVAARQRGDLVEIEVSDRGPGIAAQALPRLFEPFYRGDGTGHRPRGSGLGLAVARGLVEAHGGRMWAENRPGGGARFVFTLPLDGQTNVTRPEIAAGMGAG